MLIVGDEKDEEEGMATAECFQSGENCFEDPMLWSLEGVVTVAVRPDSQTVTLDVIGPVLGAPMHRRHVEDYLETCGVGERVTLHEGVSPSIVDAVEKVCGEPWSFAFIDGLHDGVAPRRDAEAVAPQMAETAAVAFHDLAAPAVAGGLKAFLDMGWKIRIYDTMQIAGLAWRGDYEPPIHVADPYATVLGLPHLKFLRSREAQSK